LSTAAAARYGKMVLPEKERRAVHIKKEKAFCCGLIKHKRHPRTRAVCLIVPGKGGVPLQKKWLFILLSWLERDRFVAYFGDAGGHDRRQAGLAAGTAAGQ
jgi:hypothetical protein